MTSNQTSTVSWHYVGLYGVKFQRTAYGVEVKLCCYLDQAGDLFEASCDKAAFPYLRPYTDLLGEAALGNAEPPVIPVHLAHGRATFSTAGAVYDYPELAAIHARLRNQLWRPS